MSQTGFGLGVGADDYLTKPFGLNELMQIKSINKKRSKRNKKYIEKTQSIIEFNHINVFRENGSNFF